MSEAAATITQSWGEGADVDLDAEARRLDHAVLGRWSWDWTSMSALRRWPNR